MPQRVAVLQEFQQELTEIPSAAKRLSSLRSIARLYLAIIGLHEKRLPEALCSEDQAWEAYFQTGEKLNEIISSANEAGLTAFIRSTDASEHPVVARVLGHSNEGGGLFPDSDWDEGAWRNILNGLFWLNRATYFKSWMPLLGSRAAICARGLFRETIQSPALVCTHSPVARTVRGQLRENSTLPEAAQGLGLDLTEWSLLDLAQARRQSLVAAGFHTAKGWEAGSASEIGKGVQTLDNLLHKGARHLGIDVTAHPPSSFVTPRCSQTGAGSDDSDDRCKWPVPYKCTRIGRIV